MLDPVVSARIKKYGLFKWACIDYPYLVLGAAVALVGVALGTYCAIEDTKNRQKSKYFLNYVVMRPDDPRLKNTIVFGPNGEELNN